MTRVETVTRVCDLGGGEPAAPVRLGLNGAQFEADLCAAHKAALAEDLAPFIAHARPATGRRARYRPESARREHAAMRAWAIKHAAEYGWQIAERGRMPTAVAPAWRAATRGGAR